MATIKTTYNDEGRVAGVALGDKVSRSFEYDLRGWMRRADTAVPNAIMPVKSLGLGGIEPGNDPVVDLLRKHYVETLHYADGDAPRFDGLISGRSRDSHSYTYAYDAHKRLTAANYTNAEDADADFSETYGYDEHFALTSLLRYGVVDMANDTPVYGLLDALEYTYDGNRLSSIYTMSEGEAYGNVFDERAGFGDGVDDGVNYYTYDHNGNMTSDDSRGITGISYNVYNMPTRIDLDGGDYHATEYDGTGVKLRTTYVEHPTIQPLTSIVKPTKKTTQTRRNYVGDYVFEHSDKGIIGEVVGAPVNYGTMKYSLFEGGYFDEDGKVHYYVPDFQGNTAMDVTAAGEVVQETHYYPYGEPWSQPQGQPWLYGGKERETHHALGDYDFGARTHNAARGAFAQPDPLAERYYPLNPYTFCAADPINHTDPTGAYIVKENKEEWERQKKNVENQRDIFIKMAESLSAFKE